MARVLVAAVCAGGVTAAIVSLFLIRARRRRIAAPEKEVAPPVATSAAPAGATSMVKQSLADLKSRLNQMRAEKQ